MNAERLRAPDGTFTAGMSQRERRLRLQLDRAQDMLAQEKMRHGLTRKRLAEWRAEAAKRQRIIRWMEKVQR